MQTSQYAAKQISGIDGLRVVFDSPFFKEFLVNFDGTGRAIKDVNKVLLNEHEIFGGKDLSHEFPELGQSSLYCVTEIMTKQDVDRLAEALRMVTE